MSLASDWDRGQVAVAKGTSNGKHVSARWKYLPPRCFPSFSLKERLPSPGRRTGAPPALRLAGVCHPDVATVEAQFPNLSYPRVPGHEVIGRIEEVGPWASRHGRPASVSGVGIFSEVKMEPCEGLPAAVKTVYLPESDHHRRHYGRWLCGNDDR